MLFILLSFLSSAHAGNLLGHNLFSTSNVLDKKEWTVGSYIIGYGVTENLMLATSPWLLASYNMGVAGAKYSLPFGRYRVSLEVSYFKTLDAAWAGYEQESFWNRWTYSMPLSSTYTMHLGVNHQYFMNSASTFSLRPDPWKETQHTVSAGILHQFALGDIHTLFLETGVLGMNHKLPYLHLGLSAAIQRKWGFIQLGFSVSHRASRTAPPTPNFETASNSEIAQWQNEYFNNPYSDFWIQEFDKASGGNLRLHSARTMIHPEIQIQFFL